MKFLEKCGQKQRGLKANPPVTVVTFGDSVTQGCFECFKTEEGGVQTVFDPQSAYGERLKKMLNTMYPSVQVNLINSGISGDSVIGGLERINRDVLRYSPDLVIVGYALNDASVFGRERIGEYEEKLRAIVKKIKTAGAECILLTPNFNCTKTSCHIMNEELLVNISEGLSEIQNDGVLEDFADVIRKVAKEENAALCDVYREWKNAYSAGVDVTDLLSNHLNHPIREAHYFTAFMLLKTMLDN